ncbi:hypothetical protein GFK82_00033 [Candidatus Steffania adelgidicola]|nr:hypothetical protein GFK82_00033 [Candidatus Steffania adelgidicola]
MLGIVGFFSRFPLSVTIGHSAVLISALYISVFIYCVIKTISVSIFRNT